ncbi:uncharacterized protein PV09_08853 [Verruconis gallopava]|uniref:Uncharacterized protein n=1 Tax=Verruconis gallopava TaxID=253628 RepID=A0A0D2AKM7_9PEZI|nr:uncharacterized protein PV09_08853 [Verruconis gallopava]KIV99553.1 hypothetical protein PV09_08853 [Verruconis gallopava]
MTRDAAVKDQRTHLVVLCCHAVYHGTHGRDPRKEENWALKPFQRGTDTKAGEHETFLQHAFAAVQLRNERSLVVFSGGPTDDAYPDLSEARSYLNAFEHWADAIGYAPSRDVLDGIALEEAATDSYQNVLFSILVFRRRTGHYPTSMTIITHAFKNDRFLRLHAKALKWPADRVKVLGINPPFTIAELESTEAGEKRNGFGPWETDLYGTASVLSSKRKARGWKEGKNSELAEGLEPVVQRLLLYQGREQVFPETLPWE